ncbi:hypothetical protein F4774DRAFT_415978 [Daldinia eschscholtzii]|nr:hypothetical protein F4774DRAFT_415978 [Daldinia eschscholtzii]
MPPRRMPSRYANPYLHRNPCEGCLKRSLAQYVRHRGKAFTWRCRMNTVNQTTCRLCAKVKEGCSPYLAGTLGDVEALVRIIEFVNPYFARDGSWVPRDGDLDAPERGLLNYRLSGDFRRRLAAILERLVYGFVKAHALHSKQFFPKSVGAFPAQESYRKWVQSRREYLLGLHRRNDYYQCGEPLIEWTSAVQPRLMAGDDGFRHWYAAKRMFLFELTGLLSDIFDDEVSRGLLVHFPIIPGQAPDQNDPLEFQSRAEGGGGGPGEIVDGDSDPEDRDEDEDDDEDDEDDDGDGDGDGDDDEDDDI